MAAVTTETRHATHLHIPAPARAVARGGGQILALACAAQFVVVLDIAIVNVGLPSIQRDLGVSESALQWVVIAYGLLLGGFRLFGGRMSDLLGRRRLFLTGVGTFAAASLLAGVTRSIGLLITARGLQGFGPAWWCKWPVAATAAARPARPS